MKTTRIFFALIFALMIFAAEAAASLSPAAENATENKNPMALNNEAEEYKQIFFDFLSEDKWFDFDSITKRLTIDRYEKFIKKYPNGLLVDEAKLRIAEFYSVIKECWKAKKWLDDIIKNHPSSDMEELKVKYAFVGGQVVYKGVELVFKGEKTAAWALYYRATWFPSANSKNDLLRIIKDYPESRAVEFAKEVLINKE
jgi:outer membrane protein assembly factor BamD (BamD/ComL family)